MTFAQLKVLVAGWLDDLNYGYFTESQLETWINNAQKEVQKRLIKAGQNYYLKCVQTTLVISPVQNQYVLPDDFKKLNRLAIVISGTAPNEIVIPIIPMTNNQQDLIPAGTGQPQAYFLKRNRIVLNRYPDQALIMRMDYTYLVADMSNATDVPDVPESYHELIGLLAAQDGFIKDGRDAPLLVKKIQEYEKDMDSDANERQQDAPRTIVETGSSYTSEFGW